MNKMPKRESIFVDDYGHKFLQGVNPAVKGFIQEQHVSYMCVSNGIESTAIFQILLADCLKMTEHR